MTLREAVNLALKQSPDILLARFDEVKAQQAVREARDPFVPKVLAGSGLAYSNGFPLSIEGSAPSVIRADAVQTIFNRQRSWEVAKAREDARGATIGFQAKREDVVQRVANAFLDAERAQRNAQAVGRNTESLERAAEVMRARVAEGRELELENKRFAARLAQARYRAQAFRSEQSMQEATLAYLLGYPEGDLVRPAMEEREPIPIPVDLEQAESCAVASSNELKQLQSRMQSAGLEVKANQAARLPRIELVAQYAMLARYNNYDDFFRRFQRHNGQLGMSFQIPLVVGAAAKARAAQAESEGARLRLEMNHTRSRISLETRRLMQQLRDAESLREASRLDYDAAQAQVSVLVAQMDEGRAGVRQVEESRLQENEKWLAMLEARHQVEKLRLAIAKQTGDLIAALQ